MAVPTVVGVGSAAAGTGPVTPGLPSGVQENDILVLICETYYNETITCSGYTLLGNYTHATPSRTMNVLWKRAGASESAPTTSDSGDFQIAAILAVRGCVTTGNPFGDAIFGATGSGSTTFLPGTLLTSVADSLVIGAVGAAVDNKTTANYSNWSNSSLTNIVEQLDYFSDVGSGGGLGIITATRASAGNVTQTNANQSSFVANVTFIASMIPSTAPSMFVRARGTATSGTGALTVPVPLSTTQDDILLAFVETANETVTVTGYTEAGSSPASNSGTNPTRLSVFWKRAGASESSASVSDSGDHQIAQIIAVAGARTSGDPFNVTASSSGGVGTSISIGGTTTTVENVLVLAAASSTGYAGFSGWSNSNLTNLARAVDFGVASPAGSLFVATGNYAGPGNYSATTVTQSLNVEYTTWSGALAPPGTNITLTADAGTLSVTGQDAAVAYLPAGEGALSLVGGSASISTSKMFPVDLGAFIETGSNVSLNRGRRLTASAGTFTATGNNVTFPRSIVLSAAAGMLSLAQGRNQIIAGNPARSELTFIIDLVPETAGGAYQRYTERLRVDGTDVPVISWDYSESANDVGGRLNFTIADISQKNLMTLGASVIFEVGVWNGTGWNWTSLLDTGRLRNSQHVVRTAGRGGRSAAFTVSAMSEMEDRMQACPDRHTLWKEPSYALSTAGLPVLTSTDGRTKGPDAVEITDLDFYKVIQRVFVTECGFAGVATNIPNFKVPSVDFQPGIPWAQAVAGLVGMFSPRYGSYRFNDLLYLTITDGTTGKVNGIPAGRVFTTSAATSVGVSSEFGDSAPQNSDASTFVGWLDLTVNALALEQDWQSSAERTVTETLETGKEDGEGAEYVEQTVTRTFLDRYDSRNPDVPFRSDLMTVATETKMTKVFNDTYYRDGVAITTGETKQVDVEQSVEKFEYDNGEMVFRSKATKATIPMGAPPSAGETELYTTDKGEFVTVVGDAYPAYDLRPMTHETELLTRAWHPYIPGRQYISERVVTVSGLVVVDAAQPQAGRTFMQPALDAYRSGNLVQGQTFDWVKLSSTKETFSPNGDGTVNVSKVEHDYLAEQTSFSNSRIDDGQIGHSARSGETQKVAVTPEARGEEWGLEKLFKGKTIEMNAGPLPMNLALAVAKRRLVRARKVREKYSMDVIGIDPTLQRGVLADAYGPDGEFLGTYALESKSMSGSASGYTMRVEAVREA